MSLPKFIKNLRNKVSKDNSGHELMEGSLHINNGLSYLHSYEHEGATYAEISANKANSEKRNILQINSSPDENENKALRLLFTDESGNVKEISNIYGEHFKPTPEDIGAVSKFASNRELTLNDLDVATEDISGYINNSLALSLGFDNSYYSVLSFFNGGNRTQFFIPIGQVLPPKIRIKLGDTLVYNGNIITSAESAGAMKHYNYLSNIDILQWAHEQTVSCSFAINPTVINVPAPGYWRGMLIYSSGDKAILLMGPNQLWVRCTNDGSWDGTVWTPLGGADNFLPLTGGIVSGQIASSNYDNYRIVAMDPNTGEWFGSFFRNDGASTYLLLTNPNDPYGGWSSLRPFSVDNHTGKVQMDNGLAVNGDIEGALNGVLRPTGYGYQGLSYAQTDQTFNGNTGWCHYIIANHHDGASYYNVMMALPFWGVPMYRRQEGNNTTNLKPWQTFYTTENITHGTSVSIAKENGIFIKY